MKGRKPKPAAQQVVEGDPRKRGVHKLSARAEAEPKPTRGLPACPRHLTGTARKVWKFWSAELEAMSLSARPDAMMLEGACISYQTYLNMQKKIEEQGELVAKRERNPKTGQMEVVDVRAHPGLAIRDRALMQMRAFCCEFGLSPVSRARLFVERSEADADDEFMAILSQPRISKTKSQEETVQ
jgi:P27 family predicted phage terminase small subunit